MDVIRKKQAELIPAQIRKKIIDEGIVEKAANVYVTGSPMEYLFDVYEEFIDRSGELDDFTCFKCRQKVLDEFIKMKPYL